jgi:hypothetical protein
LKIGEKRDPIRMEHNIAPYARRFSAFMLSVLGAAAQILKTRNRIALLPSVRKGKLGMEP